MRKATLLLAVLAAAIAATPLTAEAKSKKRSAAKPAAMADQNEPGRRLVFNGLSQIFVPVQSMTHQTAATPKATKKRDARKGKRNKT
jgi:hypothetical protein